MRFPTRKQTLPKDAAQALYETYYPDVLRQVIMVTSDLECAVDSTHEAFLRAFERFDTLRNHARFSSWVTSIALNVTRDALRERKRELPVGETVDEPRSAASNEPVEEAVCAREDIRSMQNAIRSMPADLRSVVVLYYMREMDTRAVSESLSIPIGTVKSRLARAREWLRREIENPD